MVAASQFPAADVPAAFLRVSPTLAVEVISPDETAVEIRGKTLEYLHAGSALVWNVYPRSREVVAFTSEGLSRTFNENDVLQDEISAAGISVRGGGIVPLTPHDRVQPHFKRATIDQA